MSADVIEHLQAYGRLMLERSVIAEHQVAQLEDRLNELAAQNAALREEHGLPPARRCVICHVPHPSTAATCNACRRVLVVTHVGERVQ